LFHAPGLGRHAETPALRPGRDVDRAVEGLLAGRYFESLAELMAVSTYFASSDVQRDQLGATLCALKV
jgi:hypothetical protein